MIPPSIKWGQISILRNTHIHKHMCVCVCAHTCSVTQSLCDPMNCSLPGSPVHGIFPARKWRLPFPPPGYLPNPGIKPMSPALAGRFFTTEPPGNHKHVYKYENIHKYTHTWRRKWQPTPVFSPRESHAQRSLAGYSPWACKSRTQLRD